YFDSSEIADDGLSDESTGGNDGTTNNSISGNNTNTKFEEPVYDLQGKTLKILTEYNFDMTKDNVFNNSIKATEQKFNCKIQFVQNSSYVDLYKILKTDAAASKATYDAVILRGYSVAPEIANSGYVLKMNEYYDFNKDATWQVDQFKDLGWFNGARYGIPYAPNEYGYGIWYNKDLLGAAGIPDLWEYVKSDQWTWDTFRSVCRTFMQKKGDTNGDGKRDNYAFTSTDPWLDFVSTNNASLVSFDSKGVPSFGLNSANAISALELIANMHNVDHSIPNGAELGEITNSPFNAMTTGKVAMYACHARYGEVLLSRGIKNFGWVYYPKGPSAKDYVVPTGSTPDMAVIPAKVSNPKEIVAVIQDAMAYWDISKPQQVKPEAKTQELYNALKKSLNADSVKLLQKQASNPNYTMANNYNLELLQESVWPEILNQSASVKSVIAKYQGSLSSKIKEMYEGSIVE
ncbi:MAG: hypothetical protein PHV07_08500, partial [Oscillospiraceae bacterium]|nr:hypothetical protein [Oscillospiraceae bacterium]